MNEARHSEAKFKCVIIDGVAARKGRARFTQRVACSLHHGLNYFVLKSGDWKRKDAKRLDSHIKELSEGKKTVVFIAPWVQPFDFTQQDKVSAW